MIKILLIALTMLSTFPTGNFEITKTYGNGIDELNVPESHKEYLASLDIAEIERMEEAICQKLIIIAGFYTCNKGIRYQITQSDGATVNGTTPSGGGSTSESIWFPVTGYDDIEVSGSVMFCNDPQMWGQASTVINGSWQSRQIMNGCNPAVINTSTYCTFTGMSGCPI